MICFRPALFPERIWAAVVLKKVIQLKTTIKILKVFLPIIGRSKNSPFEGAKTNAITPKKRQIKSFWKPDNGRSIEAYSGPCDVIRMNIMRSQI